MASTSRANENTPLIPSSVSPTSKKTSRNVTFSPNPSIIPIGSATNTLNVGAAAPNPTPQQLPGAPIHTGQPILSALNNKLRRRNSSGSTLVNFTNTPAHKGGPQRTTKNTQKLKFLPNLVCNNPWLGTN